MRAIRSKREVPPHSSEAGSSHPGSPPSEAPQEPAGTLPDAQRVATVILAVLAITFVLHWAQKFFIPLLIGIILSYTLNPIVNSLERIKIPRVVGATLVVLALIAGAALSVMSLRG